MIPKPAQAKASASYKWTALFITTLGAFMAPLDGSIVAVAIPSIASSIGMSLEIVVWIPLAYLLLLTAFLISAGRVADLKGRKRTYVFGFITFTSGSVLCGLSSTGLQLIAFRALQGIGASFIAANSAAIVTDSFPSAERGKALGINATAVYLGLMTGPVIGGFLVQNFGWPSIFFVNVPIGVVVVTLALLRLKEIRVNPQGEGFDLAGAATLAVSLATFLAGLTFGPSYGWKSITIVSTMSIAVATLILFALLEVRFARHPILELSLFTKNRMFAAANAAALFCYVAIIGVTFVMSIYLQDVLGFAPQTAGLFLIVTSTAMALLAPVSGWLSDRLGSRLLSTVGMVIVTIGLLLLSQLSASSSIQDILLRLVLIGFGFGLFTSPNTSAVMGSVSRTELGVAAGTLGMMRFMGQSIGLALAGAVIALALPPREMLALFAGLATHDTVAADAFIIGMRDFFLLSSLVAGLGTLSSMVRGRENTHETHQSAEMEIPE